MMVQRYIWQVPSSHFALIITLDYWQENNIHHHTDSVCIDGFNQLHQTSHSVFQYLKSSTSACTGDFRHRSDGLVTVFTALPEQWALSSEPCKNIHFLWWDFFPLPFLTLTGILFIRAPGCSCSMLIVTWIDKLEIFHLAIQHSLPSSYRECERVETEKPRFLQLLKC